MIINECIYASYRFNRKHSPEIIPERWAVIFPNWQEYEIRLQSEEQECLAVKSLKS